MNSFDKQVFDAINSGARSHKGVHNRKGKWYGRITTPGVINPDSGILSKTAQLGERPLTDYDRFILTIAHDLGILLIKVPHGELDMLYLKDELQQFSHRIMHDAWGQLIYRLRPRKNGKPCVSSFLWAMRKYGTENVYHEYSAFYNRFCLLSRDDPEYHKGWQMLLEEPIEAPIIRPYAGPKVRIVRPRIVDPNRMPEKRDSRQVFSQSRIAGSPETHEMDKPSTHLFFWSDIPDSFVVAKTQGNARFMLIERHPELAGDTRVEASPLMVIGETVVDAKDIAVHLCHSVSISNKPCSPSSPADSPEAPTRSCSTAT